MVYSACCVRWLSHLGAISHCPVGRSVLMICGLNTVLLTEGRVWPTELNQLRKVACFISLHYF